MYLATTHAIIFFGRKKRLQDELVGLLRLCYANLMSWTVLFFLSSFSMLQLSTNIITFTNVPVLFTIGVRLLFLFLWDYLRTSLDTDMKLGTEVFALMSAGRLL